MKKPFWKSKKCWTSVLTIVLMIANDVMDLGLAETTITSVITIVGAYLVAQGIQDKGFAEAGNNPSVSVSTSTAP